MSRYSGDDVPDNVIDQIRDWETRYRRARLSFGLMIELSHSAEMEKLHNALAEQDIRCEQLAADRLLVRIDSLDRAESIQGLIRQTLRSLGITVRWRS